MSANLSVKFVRLRPDAKAPTRATSGAAAFDLYAATSGCFLSETRTRTIIPTGFGLELPPGYIGLVCSRSGLAHNHGWFVMNAPGIIDPDYRGEIKVILSYLPMDVAWVSGLEINVIRPGDRIAQLLIVPFVDAAAEIVDSFSNNTSRGPCGFGSTGI